MLPDCGLDYALVEVEGLDRRHLWNNALVMQSLLGSVLDVFDTFRRLRPELVVVTGGYACAPSGLVAACMGIPLALQEQNSLPGVTTRLLSRHAAQIHLAWPEAKQAIPRRARNRVVVSGNPVRPPEGIGRGEARRRFGLGGGRAGRPRGGRQPGVGGAEPANHRGRARRAGASGGLSQLLWASGPAHFSGMSARTRAGRIAGLGAAGAVHRRHAGRARRGGPGCEPGGGRWPPPSSSCTGCRRSCFRFPPRPRITRLATPGRSRKRAWRCNLPEAETDAPRPLGGHDGPHARRPPHGVDGRGGPRARPAGRGRRNRCGARPAAPARAAVGDHLGGGRVSARGLRERAREGTVALHGHRRRGHVRACRALPPVRLPGDRLRSAARPERAVARGAGHSRRRRPLPPITWTASRQSWSPPP